MLLKLHDDLDAAVFDAYGWPASLSDDEILERLVALNAERAEEERRGLVRWLRPSLQCPSAAPAQGELDGLPLGTKAKAQPTAVGVAPWPKGLVERVAAVSHVLAAAPAPLSAEATARAFKKANRAAVAEILDTLVAVGQARRLDDGRYAV